MKITRRKSLLLVWVVSILGSGHFIAQATGDMRLGFAASLGLIAVSLGVPLMRAFTEFSK
jgi:hypothetical protein